MAIEAGKHYVFAPKVQINEGTRSMNLIQGALLGTPRSLYIIPVTIDDFKPAHFHETSNWSRGGDDPIEIVTNMLKNPDIQIADLEEALIQFLGTHANRFIYNIDDLELFSMKVGFWIFGGLKFRKTGGTPYKDDKAANVQPKSLREQWAQYYASKMKE